MTVFLTPDGEPFFGGTYFPPEPRGGMPSFRRCSTASPRPTGAQRAASGQAAQLTAALRGAAAPTHGAGLDEAC